MYGSFWRGSLYSYDLEEFFGGVTRVMQFSGAGCCERFALYDARTGHLSGFDWKELYPDPKAELPILALDAETYKWGFVDRNGDTLIPFEWEDAHAFADGLAWVENDAEAGYIGTDGAFRILPAQGEWEGGLPFSQGLACVFSEGREGFIDTKGRIVIPVSLDNTSAYFEGGFITVDAQAGKRFMNASGEYPFQGAWRAAGQFSNGMAAVMDDSRLWGYIDEAGQVRIPMRYQNALPFGENGRAFVSLDGKHYAMIGREGKALYGFAWEEYIPDGFTPVGGLYPVAREGRRGLMNAEGKLLIEPVWQQVFVLDGGYICLMADDQYTYINDKGAVIYGAAPSGTNIR